MLLALDSIWSIYFCCFFLYYYMFRTSGEFSAVSSQLTYGFAWIEINESNHFASGSAIFNGSTAIFALPQDIFTSFSIMAFRSLFNSNGRCNSNAFYYFWLQCFRLVGVPLPKYKRLSGWKFGVTKWFLKIESENLIWMILFSGSVGDVDRWRFRCVTACNRYYVPIFSLCTLTEN